MKVKTVVDITSGELEALINKRFELEDFIIIADQEAGNEVLVREASFTLADYDELDFKYPIYRLQVYLNIMAREGLIPAGTYNIDCTY